MSVYQVNEICNVCGIKFNLESVVAVLSGSHDSFPVDPSKYLLLNKYPPFA